MSLFDWDGSRHFPHGEYLSLGAGVQSSCLALMAACGEVGPMPKAAIFSDTQDEPASVYNWLDWLEKQLPFPVVRVTAGRLSEAAQRITSNGNTGTAIPYFMLSDDGGKGINRRSCTADYKIKPILKELRKQIGPKNIAASWRANKKEKQTPLAVSWIGISWDEMQRMKDSRDPWVVCRWPLIEKRMTRNHCLEWMASHGYPEPPRSSCVFCPFHKNKEWQRLQQHEPQEFERAVQFERALQAAKASSDNMNSTPFLHRSCVPLDQIDFRSASEKMGQLEFGFEEECEGMCGN